jgi:hypothetical protein
MERLYSGRIRAPLVSTYPYHFLDGTIRVH